MVVCVTLSVLTKMACHRFKLHYVRSNLGAIWIVSYISSRLKLMESEQVLSSQPEKFQKHLLYLSLLAVQLTLKQHTLTLLSAPSESHDLRLHRRGQQKHDESPLI